MAPMVAALDDPELAPLAVEALSKTILMFDEKFDVEEEMNAGNAFAKAGDGELGRGRVVHLEARSVREVLIVYVQGDWRDEHRRLLFGTGYLVGTRYPTSHVGNAQERTRRNS